MSCNEAIELQARKLLTKKMHEHHREDVAGATMIRTRHFQLESLRNFISTKCTVSQIAVCIASHGKKMWLIYIYESLSYWNNRLLWDALTSRGQALNAGAFPWWSVCSHSGVPLSGQTGKRSRRGARLSHLHGSATERQQQAEWGQDR